MQRARRRLQPAQVGLGLQSGGGHVERVAAQGLQGVQQLNDLTLALAQLGLQAAYQLVAFAFDISKVLVGEVGVCLLQLVFEQVPVAAQTQALVNAEVAEVLAALDAFLGIQQDSNDRPYASSGQGGEQYFTGGVFGSFARHTERTKKVDIEAAGQLRRLAFGV